MLFRQDRLFTVARAGYAFEFSVHAKPQFINEGQLTAGLAPFRLKEPLFLYDRPGLYLPDLKKLPR